MRIVLYILLIFFVGVFVNENSVSFAQQDQIQQNNEEHPYAWQWWIALIVGAIISTIIQNVFPGIVPSRIRNKISYWKKFLRKFIKNPKIKVQLIVKTSDLSAKNLKLKSVIEILKAKFVNYGVSVTANSLIIKIPIGENMLDAQLTMSTTITNDDEVIDQIECTIERECGYRNFESNIYEMRESQRKIESILSSDYAGFTESLNLICELKSKCEFIDALSKLKIETFNSKLTDNTSVNLHRNRLLVTGKDLNEQIIFFLRKMVTLYY